MTLPIKKIYVDSRFSTPDSVSNTNFRIQLNRTVSLPKHTVFYIENFVCSHSFYTIETGINDSLYMKINNNFYIIKIQTANYNGTTFAAQLQTQLNAISSIFTVVFNVNQNNLTISCTNPNTFCIYTDADLATKIANTWTGPSYTASSPHSCNDILNSNFTISPQFNSTNPYTSGALEMLAFRNLYLTSPNLSSYSTMGARGEMNIIKKIPVSSDFGYLIIDSFTSTHDWLDGSNLTLNSLEFVLKDVKGNVIPLHGSHVSFSIVFSKLHLEDN